MLEDAYIERTRRASHGHTYEHGGVHPILPRVVVIAIGVTAFVVGKRDIDRRRLEIIKRSGREALTGKSPTSK